MYVIYKTYLNEKCSDVQFPKLKRFFKQEIVEENCENPHVSLVKWRMSNNEDGIRYCIGSIK